MCGPENMVGLFQFEMYSGHYPINKKKKKKRKQCIIIDVYANRQTLLYIYTCAQAHTNKIAYKNLYFDYLIWFVYLQA